MSCPRWLPKASLQTQRPSACSMAPLSTSSANFLSLRVPNSTDGPSFKIQMKMMPETAMRGSVLMNTINLRSREGGGQSVLAKKTTQSTLAMLCQYARKQIISKTEGKMQIWVKFLSTSNH